MTRVWQDDDEDSLVINSHTVWGALIVLLGIGVLMFTPPQDMSPARFLVPAIGIALGLVCVGIGVFKHNRKGGRR